MIYPLRDDEKFMIKLNPKAFKHLNHEYDYALEPNVLAEN